MRWRRGAAAVALVVALAGLGACNDGTPSVGDALEEDADDSTTTESTESTAEAPTSTERAEAVVPRFGTEPYTVAVNVNGLDGVVTGTVEAPDRFLLTYTIGDGAEQVLVLGAEAWTRSAATTTIDTALWETTSLVDASAQGRLAAIAVEGALDRNDLTAGQVEGFVLDDLVERSATDPNSVIDLVTEASPTVVEDGVLRAEEILPDAAVGLAASTGAAAPTVDLHSDDAGALLGIVIDAPDTEAGAIVAVVTFGPAGTPLAPPAPEQLDPTPGIDEDELRAFTAAPLVAPSVLPRGLQLVGAEVLEPEVTVEGCLQVSLEYADPKSRVRGATLYVLPRACAEAFDPAPFDETLGGMPSRFDGAEVLVGDSVVQITGTLALDEEEAIAAALQPITAEALIASVVPLPD